MTGEDCVLRSFIICAAHQTLFGRSGQDMVGEACGTYGEEVKCTQCFGAETCSKQTTWKA